ncbi:purine-nucleoside phosphorylase [Qingshengfaniella alkalisoli]|uniref:Purine nucleoside permease n=1 Tax=Qingshengfaniella alkalisoli TaxID=2599296 RepID=A0A5B8I8M4_9RHOB|nr:purine nucleoside permease [Qingshengfaniella alkalisoli]QDY70385.1 purine nucleoside permease [Qingshengfaniella alkalisoli]
MLFRATTIAVTTTLLPFAAYAQEAFAPKVLANTMFDGETKPWLDNLDLDRKIDIPGLPESAPALSCNDDICVMTTTMGFANAAASVTAVALSDKLDLSQTYTIIAGIAGVDPEEGTLGSAHWARYVVDGGLRHQIDPREIPEGWETGSLKLGTAEPGADGGWEAGSELFELNPDLLTAAVEASKAVELADSDQAAEYRATYDADAAQQAPFVSACDTVSADTYWHGTTIAAEMEDHVATLTGGNGTYCTSQMEDNATLTALERGAQAGRLDFGRIAVVRTGSNFDRQAPEQSAAESLSADSGAFGPATENAFRVGNALAREIIANWDEWQDGVPASD